VSKHAKVNKTWDKSVQLVQQLIVRM